MSPAEVNAKRIAAGVCRHCGGPVPCWSIHGDRAVGKRHTIKSYIARQNAHVARKVTP